MVAVIKWNEQAVHLVSELTESKVKNNDSLKFGLMLSSVQPPVNDKWKIILRNTELCFTLASLYLVRLNCGLVVKTKRKQNNECVNNNTIPLNQIVFSAFHVLTYKFHFCYNVHQSVSAQQLMGSYWALDFNKQAMLKRPTITGWL